MASSAARVLLVAGIAWGLSSVEARAQDAVDAAAADDGTVAEESATPAGATTSAPGREAEWALSLLLAAGAMVSNDQLEVLHFDAGGGGGRLGLHVRPFSSLGIDWIEGELRAGLTVVGPGWGELGGVVDVQLGARVAPRIGDVRPYVAVGVGVGFTGPLVRGVGTGALGVALYLVDELTLAPEVTLLHVIQDDGPGQSDDALFVSFGLALTYRQVTHAPAIPDPGPELLEHHTETVIEREVRTEPPPTEPIVMEDLLSLVDLAVPGSSLQIVLLVPPLLFDHDESVLTAAGEVAMHDVLERVGESPSARVVIEGHADVTGDARHNVVLSRERAAVVGAWLVRHGVARERIREIGEGSLRPLVIGEDDVTLAPNRRVTIRLETDVPPATAPAEAP